MSRRSCRLVFALVSFAGCTASSPAPTGVDEQPIIGGAPSTTDSAVVMLASYPPNMSVLATCSAVMVSSTVLLTAAHCVDAPSHPSYTFGVFAGADANQYTTLAMLAPELLAVASVHPDPDYSSTPPYNADLAVVVLAAPLTGVTPLPFSRSAPGPSEVGTAARIVGYGETTYNTVNQSRNAATTVIAAIDTGADTITVGDATHVSCLGDSGGPALVNGTIVGLDSYTDTTGCTMPAHYTRVDLYTAFFDGFLPAMPVDAGVSSGGGDGGSGGSGGGGGCDAGGGSGGAGAIALVLALGVVVRRRRC